MDRMGQRMDRRRANETAGQRRDWSAGRGVFLCDVGNGTAVGREGIAAGVIGCMYIH